MSDDTTRDFHLDLTLSRPDLVEWLEAIPAEQLPAEVERALAAGNFVLSLLEASAGEESMRRFFRPVVKDMEELQDTIKGLLKASQVSQKIGELGESVVAKHLQQAFPGDSFDIVSQEGHQADVHAAFNVGGGRSRKALVEVKLYSHDVPSKELTKFERDLKETKVRYGLHPCSLKRAAN